jgi:glycosyltransferase involved in cell wall biosynthesis
VHLLWAGKLIRWKGLDLALRALAALGPDSRVRLSIAGDGPLRREFEVTAKELGLGGRVIFKGRVAWSDMPGEFVAADALLFTSLRDSSGSVVLEAMAHGLPVITLDHGGIGTFLPSDAGLKVRVSTIEKTVENIATAIQYLRDHPEERRQMGDAAYRYARENTWENRTTAMQAIYQEVLSAPIGR